MVKTVLEIFLCIGIADVYIFALFVATMILVKTRGMDDADDIDYAMTANVIQFCVMVVIVAEKVSKWIN